MDSSQSPRFLGIVLAAMRSGNLAGRYALHSSAQDCTSEDANLEPLHLDSRWLWKSCWKNELRVTNLSLTEGAAEQRIPDQPSGRTLGTLQTVMQRRDGVLGLVMAQRDPDPTERAKPGLAEDASHQRQWVERAERRALRLPLRYRLEGQEDWQPGETINVSESGLLFTSNEMLEVDA